MRIKIWPIENFCSLLFFRQQILLHSKDKAMRILYNLHWCYWLTNVKKEKSVWCFWCSNSHGCTTRSASQLFWSRKTFPSRNIAARISNTDPSKLLFGRKGSRITCSTWKRTILRQVLKYQKIWKAIKRTSLSFPLYHHFVHHLQTPQAILLPDSENHSNLFSFSFFFKGQLTL